MTSFLFWLCSGLQSIGRGCNTHIHEYEYDHVCAITRDHVHVIRIP